MSDESPMTTDAVDEKARRRWPWLVAAIAVLVVAAIALTAALVGGAAAPQSTSATSKPTATARPTPTAAPTPSATATPTPTTTPVPAPSVAPVSLDALEEAVVGKTYEQASLVLAEQGLRPVKVVAVGAYSASVVDTVIEIGDGWTPVGSEVPVFVYGELIVLAAPTWEPSLEIDHQFARSPVTPGVTGNLYIVSDGATCPYGAGTLVSRTVTATGGTFENGSNTFVIDASWTTVPFTVANTPGQKLTLQHTYTCRIEPGRELVSPPSRMGEYQIG